MGFVSDMGFVVPGTVRSGLHRDARWRDVIGGGVTVMGGGVTVTGGGSIVIGGGWIFIVSSFLGNKLVGRPFL